VQNGYENRGAFQYPFVLAAFNLLDARATPHSNKPLSFKAEFCARHLSERELSQMNKTLAALTDEDFEDFVLGGLEEAEALICGDPQRRMAFECWRSTLRPRRESALNALFGLGELPRSPRGVEVRNQRFLGVGVGVTSD
jgi:hypothetical protein